MKAFLLLRASIGGTTWLSKGGFLELKRKGRMWVAFTALAGLLVGGGAFLRILILNYQGLMQIGIALGHQELLLFTAMLASWVFVFFLGIPIVMSIQMFSKDTRLLASLPVREREIVAARVLRLYLYMIPLHLLIYLPAVVITALTTGVNAIYLSASILQSALGVLVPLGLAVGFVGLLMKLVNLTRYKTAVEVIGMTFGVVAAAGIQFVVVRTAAGGSGFGLTGGAASGIAAPGVPGSAGVPGAAGTVAPSGIADFFTRLLERIPPAAWSARGFFSGGLIELAGSVLVSALFLVVVVLIVQKSFLGDLSRRGEIKRRARMAGQPSKLPPARKPLKALLSREWTIISSNSTFLFEAMGEVLIFPILLGIFAIAVPEGIVESILPLLESSGVSELLIFGILVLLTMINSVAATSISREGRSFSLSLTIPIEPRRQVASKLVFQLLLFLPAYIVSMTVLMILLQAPAAAFLYYLPGGAGYISLMFFLGFYIDLKRPLLDWDHPQQAMKQNMNTLAAIGIGIGVAAVSAGVAYLLLELGLSRRLIGFLLAAAVVTAAAGVGRGVFRYAGRAYQGELEM